MDLKKAQELADDILRLHRPDTPQGQSAGIGSDKCETPGVVVVPTDSASSIHGKRRPLRCVLGLHRWKAVGYNSALNPLPVMRCTCCGIGEQYNIDGGAERWTRQQMDAALSSVRSQT